MRVNLFSRPKFEADVVLCDVGARGGVTKEWDKMSERLHLVAFEPDKKEADILLKELSSKFSSVTIISEAIWSENGSKEFYQTNSLACSSLLEPDISFLEKFSIDNKFGVASKYKMDVKSLDSSLSGYVMDIDFLKVDVQGGTLHVLSGAGDTMQATMGLLVEAEFVTVYKGEPLFGEIDNHLRKENFMLVDIRPTYWKRKARIEIQGSKGQLVYGDCLYLLDPDVFYERVKKKSAEEQRIIAIKKMLQICFVYELYDWALNYLDAVSTLLDPDQFNLLVESVRSYSKPKILPNFRYSRFIGNILKDLADRIHGSSGGPIFQDEAIGGLRRHYWKRK